MKLPRVDIPTPEHVPSQVEAAIAYVNSMPLAHKDWSIGANGMRDMVKMLALAGQAKFGARVMDILEIGTCRGLTSCLMAQVGMVHTLDVVQYPEMRGIMEGAPAGTRSRIVFLVAGDADKARRLVAAKTYDAVFIDGCHTYDAVVKDIAFASQLSNVLIFHDYDSLHENNVVRAVDEFAATCKFAVASKDSCLALCVVR